MDVAEENWYTSITIEDASPMLEQDPSPGGPTAKDLILDGISFGGSAETEIMKKFFIEAVERLALEFAKSMVIPTINEKHISIQYCSRRCVWKCRLSNLWLV